MLPYVFLSMFLGAAQSPPPSLPFVRAASLAADGDTSFLLTVEPGKPLTLLSEGETNGADDDCYVVANKRILAMDDRAGSTCNIVVVPETKTVVVWLHNNGRYAERYHLVVKQ